MFKRLLFFFILCLPAVLFADVTVPDFSFVGKEISSYELNSSFSDVKINFSANTGFDTYISQAALGFEDVEKSEYEGKDPGFMYGGKFGTGLSAVFVGEKAYRNFILKSFISKEYIELMNAYGEYRNKLKEVDLIAEIDFLYALTLLNTGAHTDAEKRLKEMALGKSLFAEYAADQLMTYYYKSGKYDRLLLFSDQLEILEPHPLYLTLYVYLNQKNYEKINKLLKIYESYKDRYPFFYDFEITGAYYSGNFDQVASLTSHASESTIFFVIDSYLMLENNIAAADQLQKVTSPEMKAYFSVKLAILDDESEMAAIYLNNIIEESDKLNLLFYYISRNFPYIDPHFMDRFSVSAANNDYLNFYKGIYYLQQKQFQKSALSLEKVSFKADLLKQVGFYKGMAYVNFNRDRASYFFIQYLNEGVDKSKLTMTRFMLAQINYLNKKYADALVVLSGCNTVYCTELKAEIFIQQRKYKSATKLLRKIKTDKSKYLTAVGLFNLNQLTNARKKLLTMKKPTVDSQLLLMNIYYKTGKLSKGDAIYATHKNDPRFFDASLKHLFLSNQFDQIKRLVETADSVTDEQRLIYAKTLYSLRQYDGAENIFREFIDRKRFLYDSIYGLISIHQVSAGKADFIKDSLKLMNQYQFDKKDFLMIQLARFALEKNDINSGIKLINRFFKIYKKSPYQTDAYIVKAGLFMKLGRYDECVSDMDSILNRKPKNEDALFQKAECLEFVDMAKAAKSYEVLSEKSDRFRSVAHIKVVEMSDNATVIAKSAAYFRGVDTLQYLISSEKLLGLVVDKEDIFQYDENVYHLMDSNDERFVPAGLYYSGMIQYKTKAYQQAARYALKSYYLFKDSKYARPSLELAKEAYVQLGKKDSAKKIEKLMKKKSKKKKK